MARKLTEWPLVIVRGQSKVTIYKLTIAGQNRFQLRFWEMGKVVRQTTSDEDAAIYAAEKIADRLRAGESSAMHLDSLQAAAYRHALEACGDTPIDAVCREWAEAKRRLGDNPLLHVVDDFVSRNKGESVSVNAVIEEFNTTLTGLSEVYTERLKDRLELVKEEWGCRLISKITEQEIREFMEAQGGSARNKKNMRDAIVTVWRWARSRGYLPRDLKTEAERVETPVEKRIKGRIGIFTVDEIKRMLQVAPDSVRPALAICAFAGVRQQGEITRLKWEDVKWDQEIIDVEGKNEPRFVPIQPNLLEWIAPFKDASGPVISVIPDRAFARAATAACVTWKHNGLRHSFGSYRVAKIKNIAETSLEMGNSPAVVKKHYLKAVHEEEAIKWFSVSPVAAPNAAAAAQ